MFANASDKYLDILLPENRMYGFAVSQRTGLNVTA